jgi:hypothetical protein
VHGPSGIKVSPERPGRDRSMLLSPGSGVPRDGQEHLKKVRFLLQNGRERACFDVKVLSFGGLCLLMSTWVKIVSY